MRIRTLLTAGIVALMAASGGAQHMGVHSNQTVESCADLDFHMDGQIAVRGEERLGVGGNVLAIRLGEGHGIPLKVVGGNAGGYELLLCKGAETSGVLAAVKLEQTGTEVSVAGPSTGEWRGYLLVRAPQNAELDIESSNGPVSVSGIAGTLEAQVTNGPLSLKQVGGRVNVRATNGPISFSGNSGEVSLVTENGPISVKLDAATWEGGELRTSAKNGPVTVKVPAGFASGIAVERGARTPFRCPAELCGERPAFFEDDQTHIEIGTGAARVHIAAKNGPISIKQE